MNKLVTLVFLFVFCACFAVFSVADETASPTREINSFDHDTPMENLILTLPEEALSSRESRYVALDPGTTQVSIVPAEISMKKEAESFARHRLHYIAFWTVFSIMFATDILWVD